MLIASQLRAGNFHHSEPISIPKQGICSVLVDDEAFTAITAYGIYLVDKGDIAFVPIPLSDEWIKLFGGKKLEYTNRDGYYQWEIAKDGLEIGIDCEDGSVQLEFGGEFPCYKISFIVKYVHELQNLYYFLTGTELQMRNDG